jgi:drug/metabolite transporter (DMT)-like permease
MWLRLMLIAFLANGLGPFGLKIIAEQGLSEAFHYQYLLLWYAGGFALTLVALLAGRMRPRPREIAIAAGMGFGSFAGQLCTSLALECNIPGHIVFPITTGGSLFVVSAAGVILFREKVGPYGIAGIVVGIASLIILSLT